MKKGGSESFITGFPDIVDCGIGENKCQFLLGYISDTIVVYYHILNDVEYQIVWNKFNGDFESSTVTANYISRCNNKPISQIKSEGRFWNFDALPKKSKDTYTYEHSFLYDENQNLWNPKIGLQFRQEFLNYAGGNYSQDPKSSSKESSVNKTIGKGLICNHGIENGFRRIRYNNGGNVFLGYSEEHGDRLNYWDEDTDDNHGGRCLCPSGHTYYVSAKKANPLLLSCVNGKTINNDWFGQYMKYMIFHKRSVVCDPTGGSNKLMLALYNYTNEIESIASGTWIDTNGSRGRFVGDYTRKSQYHKLVFRFTTDLTKSKDGMLSKIKYHELMTLTNSNQELTTHTIEAGGNLDGFKLGTEEEIIQFKIDPGSKKATLTGKKMDSRVGYSFYIEILQEHILMKSNSPFDGLKSNVISKGEWLKDGVQIRFKFNRNCMQADNYTNCLEQKNN